MSETPAEPPYAPEPDPTPPPVRVIDGKAGRKALNALTLTMLEGGRPEPFAKAQQGRADGFGKKLGIALGFKNYGAGTHVLTYLPQTPDGTLVVPVVNRGETYVTRGDGSKVATIIRMETTTADLPDGTRLLEFSGEGVEHKTDDRYRLAVRDAAGGLLAHLDLIRTHKGWNVGEDLLHFALDGFRFSTDTGKSLPTLFLGTRLVLFREPTPVELEVLLAACVELGISARAYTTEMGQETAWG